MKFKITILLLITFTCFSQNQYSDYLDNINEGHKFQNSKEYERANNQYLQALKIDDLLIINYSIYFECAFNYFSLNNEKKAQKFIIKSITDGGATITDLKDYWSMKPFQEKNYFIEIIKNFDFYRLQYFKKRGNIDVYFEVEKLSEIDQLIREINTLTWDQVSKIDDENINKVIDITKKYGWQENAWMILWHQSGTYGQKNKVWEFFKPYIDTQITLGKMSPAFWAMYEDDREVAKTGNSIYGTTYGKVDPKTVNINRAKLHLPQLTEKQIEMINKDAEEMNK